MVIEKRVAVRSKIELLWPCCLFLLGLALGCYGVRLETSKSQVTFESSYEV